MKLKVQYMAQLRPAAGRAAEDLDLPDGGSLLDLLSHLAGLREEARPHLIDGAGQARSGLLLAVNGTAVATPRAGSTFLRDGDVVTLLPPIAGG